MRPVNLKDQLEESAEWPAVQAAARALHARGHLAYLAGGSVRDGLLGRRPGDFDLVTDATGEELEEIFPKSYTVGKSFGVLVVPLEGATLEIAQFRKEGEYRDGRRPESWEPATPEQDAQRRDFTVNALFYDLKSGEVLDYVGGLKDLKTKTLKCVGDPKERLAEDKLRLFRAIRFVAQLGFTLEAATEKALRSSAQDVLRVSPERRKEELLKLLKAPYPQLGVEWMKQLGWLQFWSLGLEAYQEAEALDPVYGGSLQEQAMAFLKELGKVSQFCRQESFSLAEGLFYLGSGEELQESSLSEEEAFMLAFLLAPLRATPSEAQSEWIQSLFKILKEQHKFSSEQAKKITEGLRWARGLYQPQAQELAFWEQVSRCAEGVFLHDLLGLEELAFENAAPSTYRRKERPWELMPRYKKRAESFAFKIRPLPAPWVAGKDLVAEGLKPSEKWGQVLKVAYRSQLNGAFKNAAQALSWVRSELEKETS